MILCVRRLIKLPPLGKTGYLQYQLANKNLICLFIIIIFIIINTLQYSKRIEGQLTTRVGSPKKLKLNLLNYKTKVPRNC